ncbi:MAG: hypothetical protein IPO77_22685 [Acidobacteria bacterium]|nr:hypothetical protein [Acidobacteriota bacterium]
MSNIFFKTNERSKAEGYNDNLPNSGCQQRHARVEVVNYFTTTIKNGTREAMIRDARCDQVSAV